MIRIVDNCLILFHHFLSKKRQSTIWLYLFSSMLKMSCHKLLQRKLCICFKSPSVILSHCLFDWLSCGIHVKCVCLYKYLERRKLTTIKKLDKPPTSTRHKKKILTIHYVFWKKKTMIVMSIPFTFIL